MLARAVAFSGQDRDLPISDPQDQKKRASTASVVFRLQDDDARTCVPRPMRIVPILWGLTERDTCQFTSYPALQASSFRSPQPEPSGAARRWRDTDQVTDPAHPTWARVLPAHPRRRTGTAWARSWCDVGGVWRRPGRGAASLRSISSLVWCRRGP